MKRLGEAEEGLVVEDEEMGEAEERLVGYIYGE